MAKMPTDKFKLEPLPKENYGEFYSGDAYVCLHKPSMFERKTGMSTVSGQSIVVVGRNKKRWAQKARVLSRTSGRTHSAPPTARDHSSHCGFY
ncbi:hypothetical protein NECAME_02216 [Necator americanus]|uniref:Uncharacterized protein n=1 Tax=Necator americanus TaxID=51031 RepID=W2TH66_NECAM|nr:hypothetical protein NECAME_02216 [Necator americanus]ETN81173.1 hypothetical protein NECAME_02216 [Necator americanus]